MNRFFLISFVLSMFFASVFGNTCAATTISGKVTDENNQPLLGVNVQIKGTGIGTQTDSSGTYSLVITNNNAILLFSYVGFEDMEMKLGGQSAINVQMKVKSTSLQQVVVVGYGSQKRTDLTGAVVSANLEDFRNAPNTNIIQSLQGTVPGLNIGQVTSAGSTPSISIRGKNTISGNSSVLIILDGVQYNGSFESISPDDIASVDVLKDASSTAVYGAQAANGVLLITTRKGRKNQKARVSFSSSYATQNPTKNLRPMNRDEYLEHVRDLYYEQAYLAPSYTEPNPAFNLASKVDPSMKDASGNILPNNFNWYDAATNDGSINDHQLSVSGGGEKFSYLISGGLTNQSGFIKNDKFKRKSIRVNLESQATNWWKVGVQSFGSFVNKDGAEPDIALIMQQSPLILPYDTSGNLIPFPFKTNIANPFFVYDVSDYERHNYFFANLYSEIDVPFIKGLTYRINFGNNYRINQHNLATKYGAGQTGSAYKEFENYYDYTFDNILTYNRTFEDHNISATLLYGAIERTNSYTKSESTSFPSLALGYNSLELGTNQFANSDAWSEALNYQMARVNYKYKDKYLLTGTIRRDGFSGFSADHKYAYFPSVALGWIITRESFFQPAWIDYLKLRVGYGVSGNQTSRYFSLSKIARGAKYVFGDGGSTLFGQQVESLANSDLRWEKTAGFNTGLDFTLLKGRLTGSLEYYTTKTNDLLFNVSIPAITGFSSVNTNVGQIQNTGVELSLNSQNIVGRNFKWNTSFSFSKNDNKIIKLIGQDANKDGKEDDLVASNLFINKSINTVYDYKTNGIYQIGETIPAGYSPGTYRVVDNDNSGAITTADKTIIGKRDPGCRLSMLNTFEYKGFALSFFLNSILGAKNSYLGATSTVLIRDDNSLRYNYLSAIDYWSPNNPNGKYPRSIVAAPISPTVYENRNFVRLQNISLSYQFSGRLIEKMKIQNLNVFVTGKNLVTLTKWDGWDPESDQRLTISGRPIMKGCSVGFNLTF